MLKFENCTIKDPLPLHVENMTLQKRRKYALIGPSGVGKTSLFMAMAGFSKFALGNMSFEGAELSDLPPHKRPISMLFQSHNLFAHLSLEENVSLGLKADLKLSRDEKDQVQNIFDELDIADVASSLPRHVSGGQMARASIARVILQQKPIVLLDEPFSALGPAQGEDIRALIDDRLVRKNKLVLFVSHQTVDYLSWADAIIWVSPKGTIHAEVSKDDFFVNMESDARGYFGDILG